MKNNWTKCLTGKQIIAALGQYVERFVEDGWEAYLLTLKFRHINGSEAKRRRTMEKEVERAYASLLTYFNRHPNRACNKEKLPIWIGSFDRPVFKRAKQSLRHVTINDGLHVHIIALYHPKKRRFCTSIEEFFADKVHIYIRPDRELLDIHVEPIETNAAYVTGYGLKSLKRDSEMARNGTIYLPRTISELSTDENPRQAVLRELERRGFQF